MTTFTTEDRKSVVQGATGAQYRFVNTDPHAYQVAQIINGICQHLQALSTVIISLQQQIQTQKDHENACGK